jgi:hypothetical protein
VKVELLDRIRARDIECEHDPACRTLEGLLTAMKRAYPEFNVHDVCTLITYEVERLADP